MTPQRIRELTLAWKSMARNIEPDLDRMDRIFTGAAVNILLNSLSDFLVNMAQIEAECPHNEAAKLTDAAHEACG